MNILVSKTRGRHLWRVICPVQRQYKIYLAWNIPYRQIGLGDLIKRISRGFGIQPCGPCIRRAERLNQFLVFSGGASRIYRQLNDIKSPDSSTIWTRYSKTDSSDPCWHYYGSCTGFGRRQCITGPASQEPDAEIITHCCSGWFQYPWIEVCPGQSARTGCGFCLW